MIAADPAFTLVVRGRPAPQGSKKGFVNKYTGRVQLAESSPHVGAWRDNVRTTAIAELQGLPGFPLDEPMLVSMVFTMAKPASAPKSRRIWPATRPDLSKLARSTEDALSDAGVYTDDARIVEYKRLAKVYPGEDPDALGVPGVIVRVWRLQEVLMWGLPDTPPPAADEPATLFDPSTV